LQGAVAEILPLDEGGLETWATVVPPSGPPPRSSAWPTRPGRPHVNPAAPV